jgi:hypothetical protein
MATAYGGGYHGVGGVEALLADKYGAVGLGRGGDGGDEARADGRRLRWLPWGPGRQSYLQQRAVWC